MMGQTQPCAGGRPAAASGSTSSARAGGVVGGKSPNPAQAELVEARTLPLPQGKFTANAPLAPLVWFKSGGPAEWLFEPKDLADLQQFLRDLDPAMPVMALGLGSNLIVRDGGVPGVVVRLGKAFAWVETCVRSPAQSAASCG
jgi:UDP-N-acetylmuramate dehydrogenase